MRIRRQYLLLVIAMVVCLPSVFAISFSSGPIVSPSNNISTTDSFFCEFTATDGTLSANITWYRNGVLWSGDDQNSSVTNDLSFQSNAVDTANTAKSQTWGCQVTLNNATTSLSANSSTIILVNALPIITETLNQTAYEDSAFNLQMNATDPDTDSIIWASVDNNFSDYGDSSLFIISPTGLISFTLTDETMAGNHSMLLIANDVGEPGFSGVEVNFEFLAVNDVPIFSQPTLQGNCFEASLCNHLVVASDEEGDNLTFTANESFINISSSGVLNFTPDFSQVGVHFILINVSDGVNWTTDILNLTINSTNHAPVFVFNSTNISSATQNQSGNFTFFVNATDSDVTDTISFSIDSTCSLSNPWSITRLTNGSGSTNASAQINLNLSDNNDYVVCREVEITISDGSDQTTATFTLNISNSNDAPLLHNESYYSENDVSVQFSNTDMSNVTLAKGTPFAFRVNATDVDNLTYEGENLSYSLNGHNASLYEINSSTGLITSIALVMNDSYVGTTSFYVVVTDDEGLFANASINITVINNSLPSIVSLNDSNCTENISCFKEFVGTDAEGDNLSISFGLNFTTPNNVSTIYNSSDAATLLNITYASFNGSHTNYTVNFLPDDVHVGDYILDVTFTDNYADFDTSQINFSITNVNDVPYLGDNYSSSSSDNLTFDVVAENLPFSKTLYGIDGDMYYSQDNLTFNYSFIMGSLSLTLTKINISAATLEFTPGFSDAGNYSLNLTVIDQSGNFSSRIVNFTVYDSSQSPNITAIQPYMNASNQTLQAFTSPDASNITTIYVNETDMVTFDVQATDEDDLDMVARWYENGVLQTSDLLLIGDPSYDRSFLYNDSGVINITVKVVDRGIASYTWLVNVMDINQDPQFLNNLSDLSASQSAAITGTQVFADFMRLNSPEYIVFLDPDDDENNNNYIDGIENNTLTFSFNDSTSCDSYATFNFSGSQLTIDPTQVGNCTASFIASDSYGVNVSSNEIRVDILDLGESTDNSNSNSGSSKTKTVTQTITVPIDNDVPTTIKIVFPGISSLYGDGTVVIPFTIKNTWEEEITNIDLTFNSSVPELIGELSLLQISSLLPTQSIDLNLTYYNYRFEAPFEINLSAAIGSLGITDTATVFINALEKGSYSEDAVKTRVGFARDLLNDNSECQELNEILSSAENGEDPDLSLKLVNSVINGCKYLINTKKEPTSEVPQSFIGKVGIYTENYVDYRLLFTLIIGMTLLAIVVGMFSRFKLKKI